MGQLRALVPDDWLVELRRRDPDGGIVTVTDDEGRQGDMRVLTTDQLVPRDLDRLPVSAGGLVAAPWLSPRTRERLRERGVNYLDRTGNVEIRLRRPATYVRLTGAERDPAPVPSAAPGLRGAKAWALLRTLVEVEPPYTAGELAAALSLDDGYVSKVLRALVQERFVERRPRGPVTAVAWEPLLRQWATTYRFFDANVTSTWVASAGPAQLLADLAARATPRWAVTGSFATSGLVSVAAPEIATIYTSDVERLARIGRLLPATTGANVILAEPYDEVVFARGRSDVSFPCVSVAQMAVDLLSGNARMPSEGAALVEWMSRNPVRWKQVALGS